MKLLITGAWNDGKNHIDEIKAMGHEVVFMQYEKDALPCEYEWVEGVICNGLFLSHPIEKFPNLRYIQLTSAGFDRVDMDYVKIHDIEIRNARGVYSIPMAEFAICGVLQLYKQSAFFRENQRQHLWEKHRGLLELSGKTVLIVGCGSVGNECAKRFAAFDCRVIGVDLFPREDSLYEEILPLNQLDEALKRADIIILTLPFTEQTRHLIDENRLALLKQNAVLVNIARGEVIDTKALLKYLDNLGGAVLDVFEEEPLDKASSLWEKQNVILTPHNSFVGERNAERLQKVIVANIINTKKLR